MTPEDFWTSTFEEVLLVIKGKVDDWRIARDNSYLIYCSLTQQEHIIPKTKLLPLPYDDEIVKAEEKEDKESFEQWFKMASQQADSFVWNKN